MPIDSQQLYFRLRNLIVEMPSNMYRSTPEVLTWLGQACALVQANGDLEDEKQLKDHISHLKRPGTLAHMHAQEQIASILYRALAIAELEAPAPASGSFIPAGNVFEAFAAIGKVLATAKKDLLIVDPYMDETVLTDFCVQASEGISIRLLADSQNYKSALSPATRNWQTQYGTRRPLTAKLAAARSLHDRLILVDDDRPWVLTQSFNAFAKRAPAAIVRIDDVELAGLKCAAYEALWTSAAALA